MTTITAPLTTIALAGLVPDVVRSCIVLQPSPPSDPGEEPPDPVGDTGIYTPIAPGVIYDNLPTTTVIDTSPDQMIGCIVTVADNPQGRLNALFPSAISGDGVIDRATNDIWVYDGAVWNNVGPTPGPTIVATTVIPPWNETVLATARTRTKLEALSLAYALELLTEPDPITTVTSLLVRSIPAKIEVGSLSVAQQAHEPQVSISATVVVGSALNAALQPDAPTIYTGASVAVPAAELSASSIPPISIGASSTLIEVPLTSFSLAGLAPVYGSTGVLIALPVQTISMQAATPSLSPILGADILTTTHTSPNDRPSLINIYFRRRLVSSTYTAAEVSTACGSNSTATIYGIQFYVTTAPQYQPLPDYAIGLKNTTGGTLDNNTGSNNGTFTTVKAAGDQSFTSGTNKTIMFDTPFEWTGGNLAFVWCWGQCPTDYSLTGRMPINMVNELSLTDPRIYFLETDDAGSYTVTDTVTPNNDDEWWAYRPVFKLLYL
ncbi:MAG: hypothetical protein ACO24H_05215 [Polynucleobacter sp.]